MYPKVLAHRRPAGLLFVGLAIAGCGGGRTEAPATAPAPTAGTIAPTTRIMEVPQMVGFQKALAGGTRQANGEPGPKYWQQWADYKLEAELNPVSKRLTGHGTMQGEFLGMLPTGKPATWTEIHITRAGADGKFVEHWANVDQVSMLQQLGVIATP